MNLFFVVVVNLDFYLFPPFPLRISGEEHLGELIVTCWLIRGAENTEVIWKRDYIKDFVANN